VIQETLEEIAARALAEDVGDGDLTAAAVVDAGRRATARITQKAPGVLYGFEVAETVFRRLDPDVEWHPRSKEGLESRR
jgi:nicotinate-nucleotide pyrophosphorylase (carboxylating)